MTREWQQLDDNGHVIGTTNDPEVVKSWVLAGFTVRSVDITTIPGTQRIQEVAE